MSFDEWLSLVHPDDRVPVRAYYDRVWREAQPLELEFRVVWPDGSIHWLVSKANVLPSSPAGQPVRLIGINLDITSIKEAEQARRKSEDRFRLLIENGREVIGVLDEAAITRYVSPSVTRVFGYQASSLLGSNALEFIHPDDRLAVRQTLDAVLVAAGRSASAQFRARHSDGSWRHVEVAATNCLQIEDLRGIVVNVRDITPQTLFAEQLQASRQQLRQLAAGTESAREQERVRLAREIHDELGQMLTVLKLELEGLPFQFRRGVPAAKTLGKSLASLVRNVDVTMNTVRRIGAELRPSILTDLGLFAAFRWQIQEFAARTGILCRCRGLRSKVRLGGDESLAVFRIFQEVLTNIIRHAGASAVSIRVTVKDGRLTLLVADDGKGLDPKHLSDSRSLGLIGMQERALLFGGSVEFSARRGGGTVVTVQVPLAAPEPR
jgi:PAS domain S-box-containing protein